MHNIFIIISLLFLLLFLLGSSINLLKLSSHFTYYQVSRSEILPSAHTVYL